MSPKGQFPEADTTERELPNVGPRPAAKAAAITQAHGKLRLLVERLFVQAFSTHFVLALSSPGEGHAKQLQQSLALLIVPCGRTER